MTTVFTRTPVVAAMLTATLALAPALSFAQANRLIINRGASPQASVTLTPDSSVSIDAVTGNVVVDCAPNASNPSQCADSLGGGTPPPSFSIASSNFSQNPVQGAYPPLTTFTLSPVGTLHASYEVCQRITTGGAGQTNWSGFVAPAAAGGLVTLPSPDSAYNFALRCFADGGARTSNLLNVLSGAGSVNPGCPSNWNSEAWGAFGRKPGENRFTDMFNQATGGTAGEFPNLQGLAIFGAAVREYVSIEFNALPRFDTNGSGTIDIGDFSSLQKILTWIESQSGGFAGQANLTQGVYFSISRCPGDFRLPPANNVPDPNEPTLNLGCRNIQLISGNRFLSPGIEYAINEAPSNLRCALAYGERYFINFMTVNPLDGYQANEHNCDTFALNGSGRCGVAFQSQ